MNYYDENRIGAIIYARMDSSRLPGKVFAKLGYHSKVLDYSIDALSSLKEIEICLATSDRKIDLPLKEYAIENEIGFFQGSLNDVAKRTIDCCQLYNLDYFIRVNGDSPFINTSLILKGLELLTERNYDFISNLVTRTYPYGVSCEIIKVSTFKKYYTQFNHLEKEHITSFFYKNLKEIKFAELPLSDVNMSDLRLTIDTPEDLEVIDNFIIKSNLKSIHTYDIEVIADLFKKYTKNL